MEKSVFGLNCQTTGLRLIRSAYFSVASRKPGGSLIANAMTAPRSSDVTDRKPFRLIFTGIKPDVRSASASSSLTAAAHQHRAVRPAARQLTAELARLLGGVRRRIEAVRPLELQLCRDRNAGGLKNGSNSDEKNEEKVNLRSLRMELVPAFSVLFFWPGSVPL